MKKVIFWFSFSIVIAVYSVYTNYTNYKEYKSLNNEINELKNIIDVKESEIKRYKLISEKAEHEKIQLENKSIQTIEKLKDALKNNSCSYKRVSSYVANKLHKRASKIRLSAENSN